MKRLVVRLVLVSLAVTACSPGSTSAPAVVERTIALTFDDATLDDGPFFQGVERTERLINTLSSAGVREAMFFVTTGNVAKSGDTGPQRIRAYAAAGHALGNHSHSHLWFWQTPTDEYIADLDRAIGNLQAYDKLRPYYRFPFLDEGRSLEKRDAFREALNERGLRNGYVTVDTYDWHLVNLARDATAAGIEIDLAKLRDLYVDVIVSSTEFYDAMAQKTLGRSPHHVLLLHENDLSALFVGDLVAELQEHGFRIVPATEAFLDPIAGREPDTLFLGQGRIAALAHEAGQLPADLVSPTEDEEYLRRRFEAEVSVLPPSN
jgi:peptidoglycan/xylan/chitin deacetylase (PgdA/CDA1 family)